MNRLDRPWIRSATRRLSLTVRCEAYARRGRSALAAETLMARPIETVTQTALASDPPPAADVPSRHREAAAIFMHFAAAQHDGLTADGQSALPSAHSGLKIERVSPL